MPAFGQSSSVFFSVRAVRHTYYLYAAAWVCPASERVVALAVVCYRCGCSGYSGRDALLLHRCVSFLFGALLFREKNLRAKALDLLLVILSMLLLYIGSR